MMLGHAKPKVARSDQALAQLRSVAERLAGEKFREKGERAINAPDLNALVMGISEEVDQTVLPRVLSLTEAGQPVVNFTVSNRRLVGISTPSGDDLFQNDSGSSDIAAKLVGFLKENTAFAGPFVIAISGRAGEFFAAGASCTANDLLKAASHVGSGKGLADFYKDLRPHVDASTLLDNGQLIDQNNGTADATNALRALQIEVGKAIDTDASPHRGFVKPTCTILPLSESKRALLGFDKKTTILAVLDKEQIPSAVAAWRSQFPV